MHSGKELEISYDRVVEWRHLLQEHSFENMNVSPLSDIEVESDEVF